MDSESIADTLAAKSNQLNADDLISGPITVTITGWKRGDTKEQPVWLSISGDRMPYSPCKTMRRVLAAGWGDRPADWIGRSMTLFCDKSVMFGGVRVGGIRISHMSDLEAPSVSFMLTATRGKKAEHVVRRLDANTPRPSSKELEALRSALAERFPEAAARKAYVETIGVTGDPRKPASWTLDQIRIASEFCETRAAAPSKPVESLPDKIAAVRKALVQAVPDKEERLAIYEQNAIKNPAEDGEFDLYAIESLWTHITSINDGNRE